MNKKSVMQIAREMDQELKDKGISATFKTDSGEVHIGAEREIDEPDERGVTPLDEAIVEDGAQRLKEGE